jgi:hypothetical protein
MTLGRSTALSLLSAACALAVVPACTRDAPARPRPATAAAPANAHPFHAELLAVAASYASLPRVDGTRWALEDCVAPRYPSYLSRAETGEHRRKIYTLFIKDLASYAALSGQTVVERPAKWKMPELDVMSQVIVKEAWTAVESTASQVPCGSSNITSFLSPVTLDGKTFKACEPTGLFVMYRPAQVTPGTDDGWVYGVVQYESRADARSGQAEHLPRVTAAGRIESCMGCHANAPHGRLFGIPPKG